MTPFSINPFRLSGVFALVAATALGAIGCATTPDQTTTSYRIAADTAAAQTLADWFDRDGTAGQMPAADAAPAAGAGITRVFADAEIAYWKGDVEAAGELYLRMLSAAPAHPLCRFAAGRLYALRDEMVDFSARVQPVIASITLGDVPPLTRVYLSLVGQQVSWHQWKISDDASPFSADPLGFPARWMTTPMLSSWRLRDFDRSFAIEDQPHIQASYLSPYVAKDRPVNYEKSRPFVADGLNLSPDFDHSGIHYLETFATVEPAADGGGRDYLVYASLSGASRIWIDGQQVIERREGHYGTTKYLRRIHLPAGQHRVLVKMGYQSGYRDWFDLAFLGDQATALGGSALSFGRRPDEAADDGADDGADVDLLGQQMRPAQLEPVLVDADQVDQAGDVALYLSANAAFMDQQPGYFEPAFDELMERHPKFGPGYLLHAQQLQTLWEVPSRIRDSRSLTAIRRAHKLDPASIKSTLRLIARLRQQGRSDQEVRALLDDVRQYATAGPADAESPDGRSEGQSDGQSDGQSKGQFGDQTGRLRNVGPLVAWADWLTDQGWSESAEKAWKAVLELAPTECGAASQLQQLYYQRSYMPALDTLTPAWQSCPDLGERRAFERADLDAQRLSVHRKRAGRFPYRSSAQIDYADELVAQGQPDRAIEVLENARQRMPRQLRIWNELANAKLASDGKQAAVDVLQDAIDQHGNAGWLQWRLAVLQNKLPLESLMHDGLAEARADIDNGAETVADAPPDASGKATGDEAYYVLDYAARKYFADGSSVALTHTVVRVLTKGAIDRFGEFDAPNNARLILARTIKQDGSTRVPQDTAGKSTLSMPGLAPGDFVETAYVQYQGPSSLSKTRRAGTRFFFRMGDISSRHSEYVVVDPKGKFYRANHAPEPQAIDTAVGSAVRFERDDSPRPRREPSTPGWEEFLPWIQLHRSGITIDSFEASRRALAERVRDSLKMSRQLDDQIAHWRADLEPGTAAEVRGLFYKVAAWFPDPSPRDLSKDASHALLEHDGSPLLVLKAAYDKAGIPAELYMAKSKFKTPAVYPANEFGKYQAPLLRVEMPDGPPKWVSPMGPDAMFGSIGLAKIGQPAVCVSCETSTKTVVPDTGHRDATRQVDVTADLDKSGTLAGTMTMTYHGIRAYVMRRGLRKRADKSSRHKFVDLIISGLLPGASLQSFEISGEHTPDEALVVEAHFERAQFARQVRPGVMQVETTLFRNPIASAYAELSDRTTPLLIRSQRAYDYSCQIGLPDGYQASVRSKTGQWELDGQWGRYRRNVGIVGDTLGVTSSLAMPIERISAQSYDAFQKWAIGVERSSLLFLRLQKSG